MSSKAPLPPRPPLSSQGPTTLVWFPVPLSLKTLAARRIKPREHAGASPAGTLFFSCHDIRPMATVPRRGLRTCRVAAPTG